MPNCKACFRAMRVDQRKGWSARSYKNSKIKNQYGITLEVYEKMLEAQEGKCLVCEDALTVPHIDHCHVTGKVRGLLCKHCNTGLGHFKDNITNLERAILYLRRA